MHKQKYPIICKDTGEQIYSYKEYLLSEHWNNLRNRCKKKKYFCYICSRKSNLNLHHKTYKRLGCEKLMDIIWLCKECHKELHERLKKMKPGSLWSISKRMRKRYEKTGRKINLPEITLTLDDGSPWTLNIKEVGMILKNYEAIKKFYNGELTE